MEHVVKVIALNNYHLELWFNTGDHKLFDCTPYLNRGVFTALKDLNFFMRVFIQDGTVCWPNHLDLSPETLFDKSVAIVNST